MEPSGTILYQCKTAERLLLLANYPTIVRDTPLNLNLIQQVLKQLCRRLDAIFQGQDAPPPSYTHQNGCGRFIFKAHWLEPQNREPGGLVAVSIKHQEPLTLAILRALRNVSLSPVQKEVALMLTQGLSTEKIGERLHIKYNTVKDHIKKIFDKLDIHSRQELMPKLLAMGKYEP